MPHVLLSILELLQKDGEAKCFSCLVCCCFFVCLFVFDQAAVSAYLLQCELDNVRDIRMKMDWTKYFINAIGDLVMLRQKPLETGICSDHVI